MRISPYLVLRGRKDQYDIDYSIFRKAVEETQTREELIKYMEEQLYKKNKRWVVTYSGGKDSTALVVLSLYMKTLHPDIDLNITYSDTMMEIPQMSAVAYSFLTAIEERYPAQVKIVKPEIEDTYWVRMIGRGYPPPGPRQAEFQESPSYQVS